MSSVAKLNLKDECKKETDIKKRKKCHKWFLKLIDISICELKTQKDRL